MAPPSDQAVAQTGGIRGDWTGQVAERIEAFVGVARDRSIRPLTVVAKALVYGLIVMAMFTVVVIVLSIAVVRGLNVALSDWISEAAVGGFLTLGGLFLLIRSRRGR